MSRYTDVYVLKPNPIKVPLKGWVLLEVVFLLLLLQKTFAEVKEKPTYPSQAGPGDAPLRRRPCHRPCVRALQTLSSTSSDCSLMEPLGNTSLYSCLPGCFKAQEQKQDVSISYWFSLSLNPNAPLAFAVWKRRPPKSN